MISFAMLALLLHVNVTLKCICSRKLELAIVIKPTADKLKLERTARLQPAANIGLTLYYAWTSCR